MSAPMSPERLADIRAALVHTRSQIEQASGWDLEHYKAVQQRFHETRLLLAEVERLRAELDARPTRAEALREAADWVDSTPPPKGYTNTFDAGALWAATGLRDMADADQERTFLQPGRTYTSGGPYTAPEIRLLFQVEHVTRHPDRGHLRAFGWMRSAAPGSGWHGSFLDEDQVEGWVEEPVEEGEQEPGSPAPLRWGQGDAEMGDDDSVTLWLSGPDGEPYVLELDPERAAALRGVLAERSGGDCCCEPERDHDDLTLPTAYLHQVGCPVAEREEREAGRG